MGSLNNKTKITLPPIRCYDPLSQLGCNGIDSKDIEVPAPLDQTSWMRLPSSQCDETMQPISQLIHPLESPQTHVGTSSYPSPVELVSQMNILSTSDSPTDTQGKRRRSFHTFEQRESIFSKNHRNSVYPGYNDKGYSGPIPPLFVPVNRSFSRRCTYMRPNLYSPVSPKAMVTRHYRFNYGKRPSYCSEPVDQRDYLTRPYYDPFETNFQTEQSKDDIKCDETKETGKKKPRWSAEDRMQLIMAIIEDKKLGDMTTFNWEHVATRVNRGSKACKDQWRREILPALQKLPYMNQLSSRELVNDNPL
ncbi:hypothetical protein G6F70_001683 [Rhizopus microsporus]|uniref:Myb-like domain-containing protein n=2 Tax=Rhizopus TaxID=4842 RepID=A0A367JUW9_RHIAZ|nr:hypothetical protein G6F71_000136 [Rhizopus microsporus]RCH93707.1 hypothetical protein CU097_011733 [Rhizopus azygosporus]KAG1203133.1 hypothetical protein G6F70_001683 [Rhizopus microsporus]KAG1215021.1 hypothetical protein G6F69_001422 [Rhizopus microsporus]KAG1238446.1 hypothetical protein G6F67_000430 [Rhizopus microsporus]